MAQPSHSSSGAQPPLNIVIEPATLDDVDALGAMAGAAFKTDTHTQLKALFDGENAHEEGWKEAMKSWIPHPKVDVIVAREVESGRLVGHVAWVRRGFQGDVDYPLDDPVELEVQDGPKTIADLKNFSSNGMTSWVKKLMPEGTRCRFMTGINVDPAYQGRGVGSRLMQWGTDKADSEGIFCWVSSSMGGKSAFEKQGFREVGRVEANLDEYAEGKQRPLEEGSKDGSWGDYIWYYMKREPKV